MYFLMDKFWNHSWALDAKPTQAAAFTVLMFTNFVTFHPHVVIDIILCLFPLWLITIQVNYTTQAFNCN